MIDARYDNLYDSRHYNCLSERVDPPKGLLSSWKDMIIVFLLLVYSGNPAMGRVFPIEPQLIGLALFFGGLLVRRAKPLVSKEFGVIAFAFIIIFCIQGISFEFWPVVSIAGFAVRFYLGFAMIRLVDDFPRVYVRVMYGLALTSFVFYFSYVLLHLVGINVESYIASLSSVLRMWTLDRRPLLVHTFDGTYSNRNFGMFWEPGAFQGYLILSMVFLMVIKNRIEKTQYQRYLGAFCIAILTTMSTTGYIAMVLVLLLQYEWYVEDTRTMNNRILLGVFVILPLVLAGGYIAYSKLPFLGEKIERQLHFLNRRQGTWHRGRFGSMVFDWEYIQKRPLTGWGLHSRTRYALHPQMANSEGMGNGFSDFTAKFGLVGISIWLIAVLRSFRRLLVGSHFKVGVIGVLLLLLLQGECFLAYPLFLGLAFLADSEDAVMEETLDKWPEESGYSITSSHCW
ncbi:O-antigen ligase family protein [Planctomycetota bacterium]